MLTYLFHALLITSMMGTVLAMLLMIFRPLTRKYFSAGWHYYAWLSVLLVMLVPVRFILPESTTKSIEMIESTRPVSEVSEYYQVVEMPQKDEIPEQSENENVKPLKWYGSKIPLSMVLVGRCSFDVVP